KIDFLSIVYEYSEGLFERVPEFIIFVRAFVVNVLPVK
ncbi:MAG: hypothetical protein RIS47_1553, partial [Bacteroidota bacterium]